MSDLLHVDARYARLASAFQENFSERGDLGAAIAVVEDGELVVNFWSGYRDQAKTLPWEATTLVNIWSTTKGIVAACVAILVDRKLLDYDEKVSRYWPEFALAGKGGITVRMLLSHQAGLCGFDAPVELDLIYDEARAANWLSSMAPLWQPGDGCGYHAITVGYLVNEIFRRTDGRSLKEFVADEIYRAFKLDMHIGLPLGRLDDVANIQAPVMASSQRRELDLSVYQHAAFANPVLSPELANSDLWHAAEIPSANGFATACALANLYGALAAEGKIGEKVLLSKNIVSDASQIAISSVDRVLGIKANWAAGFLRNTHGVYGPNESSFGHSGWGGSFAFADPERRLGFAYVMNSMGTELVGDPRNLALIEALYSC